MALVHKDRVKETSTTTGTGTYTLAGAVSAAYQAFSVIGNGNTCFYTAEDATGWEVGIGTWATGGTLARTSILASSNAGAAVNWGAGTRVIFNGIPAGRDHRGGILKTHNKKDPYFRRTHTSDALGYWIAYEEPVRAPRDARTNNVVIPSPGYAANV